jgi:hypothetical protein
MTTDDTQNTKSSFEDLGRTLDKNLGEAAKKLDQETEKVVTYLNDEVVPAVRSGSTKALRAAAEQLSRLADFMDKDRSSS